MRNTTESGKATRVLLVLGILIVFGGTLTWAYVAFLKKSDDPPRAKAKEDDDVLILGPSSADTAKEDAEHERKVHAAVERGVAHLKKRILSKEVFYPTHGADNRFGDQALTGATALTGLAMLETGTPLSDPAMVRVLEVVREKGKALTVIYPLGATLFFLNRLGDAGVLTEGDRALHKTLALRLVNGQLADGGWYYDNPPLSAEQEKSLIERLEGNDFAPTKGGTASSSMTQFALMALWGSRRHGIPVRQTFLHAAARFHKLQLPNGAWNYGAGGEALLLNDSNTCAGLMSLAMEKVVRRDKEYLGREHKVDPPPTASSDERRDKAIAFLGKVVGRRKDDPTLEHGYLGTIFRADAWGDIYFLWSLERVAVIYGWQNIEGKDWYRWASETLLAQQKADGSWIDRHGDIADTCFAILVLRRANLAQDLTEQLRGFSK